MPDRTRKKFDSAGDQTNGQWREWHSTILNSIADGVFTVDSAFRITSFNRAAQEITGYSAEEAIGRPCHEVFQASICRRACALRQTLSGGKGVINERVEVTNKRGQRIPISISTAVLRLPDGRQAGGVETFRDLSAVEALRAQARMHFDVNDLVGRHPSLQRIVEILPDVAGSDATVLIQGGSGSGKGLLASIIHNLSPRRNRPFVKVCCAALPESLLESELFGYVRGAFTDAKRDKPGRFAVADGGTLFLDEIGEVTPAVQVKLLRVLQEREYEPLGSTRTLKADVRILAATNADLDALMLQGRFRQDLFYRLNVVAVHLPPLSERREDIPRLVDRFVAVQNERTHKGLPGLSEAALLRLMSYDFPGNVRELENAIEHAFVLCRSGLIEPEHLPSGITSIAGRSSAPDSELGPREAAEARVIREVLRRCNGNRAAAAIELKMHRTTLWRKLRQYGIARR